MLPIHDTAKVAFLLHMSGDGDYMQEEDFRGHGPFHPITEGTARDQVVELIADVGVDTVDPNSSDLHAAVCARLLPEPHELLEGDVPN